MKAHPRQNEASRLTTTTAALVRELARLHREVVALHEESAQLRDEIAHRSKREEMIELTELALGPQRDCRGYAGARESREEPRGMKLSVVIPAHNEEGCIAATVTALERALTATNVTHEILLVNDNCSDRTEEILLELARNFRSVRSINNRPPHGSALRYAAG